MKPSNTRPLIVLATLLTLVGIALSVGDDEGLGGILTLLGLVLSIVALHRFGRLGPDASRIAPDPNAES